MSAGNGWFNVVMAASTSGRDKRARREGTHRQWARSSTSWREGVFDRIQQHVLDHALEMPKVPTGAAPAARDPSLR